MKDQHSLITKSCFSIDISVVKGREMLDANLSFRLAKPQVTNAALYLLQGLSIKEWA